MLKKMITLTIIIAFTLTFLQNCDTTEPPSNKTISLTFEDASSTEVWLNLKTENISLPQRVELLQNDSLVLTANINNNDTTLYIENLLPNRTYSFYSTIPSFQNSSAIKSNKVSVTTMDTTSHNFTWQTFTFGGANGSSILRDVAIINENDIWAVGEIHTAETDQFDSNGVWVQPYNAVHWDGTSWELKRFYFKDFCNQQTTHVYPARAILTFSKTEIFITSGSQIINYNGNKQNTPQCIPVSVNAMWGTSSSDFYVVGDGGNIAHYNGSPSADGWTKIESGTETQIRDIWGYTNKITERKKVLCAVSNVITLGDNKILEINGDNTISEITWNTGDLDKRVNSIWFNNNYQIFTCGGGVYISKENGLWAKQPLPSIHTNKIRGKETNDVFVAGDFGLIAHFNGFSWKVYSEANVALFYSLDYKKNILTAVGERNAKGVLLMMRKQ